MEIDHHFMILDLRRQRDMVNQAQYLQYMMNVKDQDIVLDETMLRCMHYSWMANRLTEVYKMMPRNLWNTYHEKLSDPNNRDVRIGLKGCKELSHQLCYLTSYDNCEDAIKAFDKESAHNIYNYLRNNSYN